MFIGAWMRSPLSMGAVIPSSRSLARAMAEQVDVGAPGTVVELGAGTGAVTQALVKLKLATDCLISIERDSKLISILAHRFPQLKVLNADAVHLDKALASAGVTRINAIVSSLPLLSLPKPIRSAIEQQMAEAIAAGGKIVQFTYGPKSPISQATLRKYGLTAQRVKTVLVNVPPAQVWVYQRGGGL